MLANMPMLSLPRYQIILAALACVLVVNRSAFAQALPDATGTYNIYDEDAYGTGFQNVDSSTSLDWLDTNPAGVIGSNGSISLNFTTDPSVTATATAVNSDGAGEKIIAIDTLTYNFEVVYTGTGTPDSTVPIDVAGEFFVAGQNNDGGSATINVYDGGEFGIESWGGNGSDAFDLQGQANVGDPYTVYLNATVGAGGLGDETEIETASVDSLITIDGAGLSDPSDYQIVFSPNLGPAGVPDTMPTAGAFVVALLPLAVLAWRNRRSGIRIVVD
jgi:hypothetical protein